MSKDNIKRRHSKTLSLSPKKRNRQLTRNSFNNGGLFGDYNGAAKGLGWREASKGVFDEAFNSKNALSSIGAVTGALSNMAGAFTDNSQIADTSAIENNISEAQNANFTGATDTNSLLDSWNSIDWQDSDYTAQDVRGMSGGEMFGNTLGAVGSGVAAGATIGGPIGAIVGGVAGLGSSLAGIFTGNRKAEQKASELNLAAEKANIAAQNRFAYQADKVHDNMYSDLAKNISAYGGNLMKDGGGIYIKPSKRGTFTAAAKKRGKGVQEFARQVLANKDNYSPAMVKKANFARNFGGRKKAIGGELNTHGTEWDNGLTYINAGGTHEQNPFDGVQMGMDAQNVPNLVEEGEVIFNDYVFSNRLHPTEEELESVNLPNKYKNSSFAYIAEDLSKESSERPNDPISRTGLENMMSRLATAQEMQRERKGKKGTQQLMMYGGRKYAGNLDTYGNFTPVTDSFYTPEYLEFWNYMRRNPESEIATTLLNDINSGKYGEIGGNTFTIDDIVRLGHDYKKGPVHQALLAAMADYNPEDYLAFGLPLPAAPVALTTRATLMNTPSILPRSTSSTSSPSRNNNTDNGADENLPTYLRYAPAIGSAIGALQSAFETPDYENADILMTEASSLPNPRVSFRPIGDYLTYRPLDRNYYLNQLRGQAGATRRAIMNSGANASSAMAGLLAADYNAQNAIGNTLMQMQQYNDAQRQRTAEFNRGTNQFNSQGLYTADAANARLTADRSRLRSSLLTNAAQMRENADAQLEASRSANMTNFFDNLGGIGTENFVMNQIRSNPANQGTYIDALRGIIGFRGANGGMLTKKNSRRRK